MGEYKIGGNLNITMPKKQRGNVATQRLTHVCKAVSSGTDKTDVLAGCFSVIEGRPMKPLWLDVTYAAATINPIPFQVILFQTGGGEVNRTKPLLATLTVQRVRLPCPPGTDFGLFAATDKLVRLEHGTTADIQVVFNLHAAYKPQHLTFV